MTHRVIKKKRPDEAAPSTRDKVIAREVFEAHDKARAIVRQAEAEAAAILEKARAEAEAIRETARRSGFRDGLANWEARGAELLDARRRLVDDARPQIVDAALRVASKILHRQLETEPESVAKVVEEAIRTLGGSTAHRLRVLVNPEDAPAVCELRKRLRDEDPMWEVLVISTDESMARGGCRVTSEYGEIDASVETQLAAMRRILTGAGNQPNDA